MYHTSLSKQKIEDAFSGLGLSRNSPHVGTYETLVGDDANPRNILAKCEEISRRAGPNDAVFVYILCHGATVVEDNDPSGTRVHALSPIAMDASNLDLRNIGIRRSSIMRVLKSNPHRLDVLITDACAVPAITQPPRPPTIALSPAVLDFEVPVVPKLVQLLRFGRGTININSASPTGGRMQEGELAVAWVPAGWQPGQAGKALVGYDQFGGTVFTNAFVGVGRGMVPANQLYTPDEFYNDLKVALDGQFKNTKDFLNEQGDPSIRQFLRNQSTQTLTRFDDWGVERK